MLLSGRLERERLDGIATSSSVGSESALATTVILSPELGPAGEMFRSGDNDKGNCAPRGSFSGEAERLEVSLAAVVRNTLDDRSNRRP